MQRAIVSLSVEPSDDTCTFLFGPGSVIPKRNQCSVLDNVPGKLDQQLWMATVINISSGQLGFQTFLVCFI